jgi:hypothetical protein
MAAAPTDDAPAQRFEGRHHSRRPEQRDRRHQAGISICLVTTVSGSPGSARAARHSRIASARFASASLSVRPWLTHPGIAGHSAMTVPPSSRVSVMVSFAEEPSAGYMPSGPGRTLIAPGRTADIV